MADGNPFAPPQVDIAGNVNDLIQNYRRAQLFRQQQAEYQKQQQLQAQRKDALSGLMQGGDPAQSIQKLMGIGDLEGAQALATAVKTMRPPQLTPGEILAHQDRMATLAEQGKTPDIKNYEYMQAQSGQQPPGATTPTTFSEFQQQKKVKQVSSEDLQGHYDTVNQQLTAMNQTIQDILKDPELDYVVGRGSIGARFSLPGSAYRTTASKLDQLENQAKLYGTVQLRESSKTGSSGFGRLTNTEFGTFGDLFANLRRGQDPETYRKNLIALSQHISDSQSRMKDRLDREIGGRTGQDTGVPGEQTVNTPPPPGVVPAASSPKGMNDQQTINLARQLRQQGLNKDQIIQWFKARGVTIEP